MSIKDVFKLGRRGRRATKDESQVGAEKAFMGLPSGSGHRRLRTVSSTPAFPSPSAAAATACPPSSFRQPKQKRSMLFRYFAPCRDDPSSSSTANSNYSSVPTTPGYSPDAKPTDRMSEYFQDSGLQATLISLPQRSVSTPPVRKLNTMDSADSLSSKASTSYYSTSPRHSKFAALPPKLTLDMPATKTYVTRKILPKIPLSAVEQSPQFPEAPRPSFDLGSDESRNSSERYTHKRSNTVGAVKAKAVQRSKRPGTAPSMTPPPPIVTVQAAFQRDSMDEPPSPAPIEDDMETPVALPRLSPRPVQSGRKSPNVRPLPPKPPVLFNQ